MKSYILLSLICLLTFLLRVFNLAGNPPSLYWDEASLGYNAYLIATSGHDEHGEFLPIDRFIAFGDYKPPGYIYASVPFVWILGLNEVSIRLPSVFAGTLMAIATFFFVRELFAKRKIALLAAFFLAVSPWSIQLSRGAFEANLAASFNLWALYFLLLARRRHWVITLSSFLFALSFYTFNANRIIAPLLFVALCIVYWKRFVLHKTSFFVAILIWVLLLIPSFRFLTDRESRLRFQEVSIFTSLEPVVTANERMERMEGNWAGRILNNRRVLFFIDFLKHYTDNFSGRFLFTHGDGNPRLHVQDMGELYVWELPFLVAGSIFLLLRRDRLLWTLLLWMIVAPVPAGTARETPHALRIASILPTFQIVIAYGVYRLQNHNFISNKRPFGQKAILSLVCVLFSVNAYYYLHVSHIHYPREWSGEWQYGYKEMVQYVTRVQNEYDHIFVTSALGRPYIYFAFYNQYPIEVFLNNREASRDWFGFWEVSSLRNISFDFASLPYATGNILVVASPEHIPEGYSVLKHINNLPGEKVFVIAEK